jgi:hypothetical protein
MITTFSGNHVHLDVLKYFIRLRPGFVYTEWPHLRDFLWAHEDQHEFIKKTIDDIRGQKPLIINTAIDAHGLPYVAGYAVKYDLNSRCIFLVSDPHLNVSCFRFFPQFILRAMSQRRGPAGKENPDVTWGKREKKVNFLNRTARAHRIYAFYLMQKFSWVDQELVSFGNVDNVYENNQFIMTEQTHEDLMQKAKQSKFYTAELDKFFQEFKHKFPFSPEGNDDLFTGNLIYDAGAKSYRSSYLSFVTESNVDQFFPTEKITKPLLMGNLPLCLANQYYMKTLDEIGFDLDYDGIPYTDYDTQVHWQHRCEIISQKINYIYSNIEDIWNQNLTRLRHNSELFSSDDFANQFIQPVNDVFERVYVS